MTHFPDLNIFLVYERLNRTGGIQRVMLQQRSALSKHFNAQDFDMKKKVAWKGISFSSYLANFISFLTILLQRQRLNRKLVIVHGYSRPSPFLTGLACWLSSTPYIWMPHSHPFKHHRRPLLSKLYFKIFNVHVGRHAEAIIAINDSEVHFFERIYGLSKRIVLIPNAYGKVDMGKFECEDECFTQLPERFFLFVGRNDSNKNLNFLLENIAILRGFNASLVIVSDSTAKKDVDGVFFYSGVSDKELACLYTQAEAVIVPSKYEAFSLVALEAASYGTPVICSNTVAYAKFSVTKRICFPFSMNLSSFADSIRQFYRWSPELSERDYRAVLNYFSIDSMEVGLVSVVRSVFGDLSPPTSN